MNLLPESSRWIRWAGTHVNVISLQLWVGHTRPRAASGGPHGPLPQCIAAVNASITNDPDTLWYIFIILYPHQNCPFISGWSRLMLQTAVPCCAHHLASTANFTHPVLFQWADDEPRALQARAFHTNLTQVTQVRLQRNLLQRSSKTWIDFKLRSWT